MAFGRVVEYGIVSIVGTERIIFRLQTHKGPEPVLDSDPAIIKDGSFGNAAKFLEGVHGRFMEAFLILPAVSQNDRSAAVVKPCTKQVYAVPRSIFIDVSFAPVYLQGIAWIKLQWHKCLGNSTFEFPDFSADR